MGLLTESLPSQNPTLFLLKPVSPLDLVCEKTSVSLPESGYLMGVAPFFQSLRMLFKRSSCGPPPRQPLPGTPLSQKPHTRKLDSVENLRSLLLRSVMESAPWNSQRAFAQCGKSLFSAPPRPLGNSETGANLLLEISCLRFKRSPHAEHLQGAETPLDYAFAFFLPHLQVRFLFHPRPPPSLNERPDSFK